MSWDKERTSAIRRALSEWYESQRRADSTLPIGDTDEIWAVLRDLEAEQPEPRPARQPKLKLYVWEDAFADYWPGLAIALAHDVREARRTVARQYAGPGAKPGDSMYDSAMREVAGRPEVIRLDENTRPQAWQVSGGG